MIDLTRKRLGLVAGAVGAAVTLSACWGGNPNGPHVYVLGDSIIHDATGAIADALNPAYATFILGQDGYTIAQSEGQFTGALGLHNDPPPNRVALEMGTNDAVQYNTGWQADYEQMWSEAATEECVTFVNVATNLAETNLGRLEGTTPVADVIATNIDAWIDQKRAENSNVRVVDWNTMIQTHPGWTDDGIHPNAQGDTALASAIVQAEQSCP